VKPESRKHGALKKLIKSKEASTAQTYPHGWFGHPKAAFSKASFTYLSFYDFIEEDACPLTYPVMVSWTID
jgi:hypothetical protein